MQRSGRAGKDTFTLWVARDIMEMPYDFQLNVGLSVLELAAVGGLAVEGNDASG